MNKELILHNFKDIFNQIDLLNSKAIKFLSDEINLYNEELTKENIKYIRLDIDQNLMIARKKHNRLNLYRYDEIIKVIENKKVLEILEFINNIFNYEFIESSFYFKSIQNKPFIFLNTNL